MMDEVFIKKSIKMATWIIVMSIIGLSFISILPFVTDFSVQEGVVHNLGTIKSSNNEQIKGLGGDLELINLIFWLTIIFALIATIGIMSCTTRKISLISQIITMLGSTTLFLSALNIFLIWSFIVKIESIDTISSLLLTNHILLNYGHITLIIGFISLLVSMFYTITTISFSVNFFSNQKKTKKSVKKETKQKPIETQISDKKKEIASKKWVEEEKREIPNPIEKPIKAPIVKNDLFPKKTSLYGLLSESDNEYPFKAENSKKQGEIIDTNKKFFSQKPSEIPKEKKVEPFKQKIFPEELSDQPKDSEEPPSQSPLFEQALSSAIKKSRSKSEKKVIEK